MLGELRLKVSKEDEDEGARIEREREAMEERGLGVIINMQDFEVSFMRRSSCSYRCCSSPSFFFPSSMWHRFCLSLNDHVVVCCRAEACMQKFAGPMISKVAWAYYASAADDEISGSILPPFRKSALVLLTRTT